MSSWIRPLKNLLGEDEDDDDDDDDGDGDDDDDDDDDGDGDEDEDDVKYALGVKVLETTGVTII